MVISWRRATAHNFRRNFVRPLIFGAIVTVILPAIYWFFRLRFLVGDDGQGLDIGFGDLLGAINAVAIFVLFLVTSGFGLALITAKGKSPVVGIIMLVFGAKSLGGLWFYLYELPHWEQSFFASDMATDIFYSLVVLFFCAFVTLFAFVFVAKGARNSVYVFGVAAAFFALCSSLNSKSFSIKKMGQETLVATTPVLEKWNFPSMDHQWTRSPRN